MSRKGYNISGVPKWKGSVEDGIEYIKSFNRIFIHPRCAGTIEEFMKYSYKVDRHTQEILPVLESGYDHFCDSARYGLADYIKSDVSIFDSM
jgi:phage terminase large subunit